LLVFGPEAKTRVWLVVDGDDLYVDANANGDLTEAGEKFSFLKPGPSGHPQSGDERSVVGVTIHDGKLKHTELRLCQQRIRPNFKPTNEHDKQLAELAKRDPQTLVCSLQINVEMRAFPRGKIPFTGRIAQHAGEDAQGYLQFAAKRQDAPVVYFGGAGEMR